MYKSSSWTMAIKSWSASRRWNPYRLKLRMALLMRYGVRGWLCLREATRARGLACCVVSLKLRRTSKNARAAFQLIDEKEGDIEAMVLAIHKNSMGWLYHYDFLLLCCKLHGLFLGQRTEIWGWELDYTGDCIHRLSKQMR